MCYHCTLPHFTVPGPHSFIPTQTQTHTHSPPPPRHVFIHAGPRSHLFVLLLFLLFLVTSPARLLLLRLFLLRVETSVFRPGRFSFVFFFWVGSEVAGSVVREQPFVAATCAPLFPVLLFFFLVSRLALYWLTKCQTLEISLYPFFFIFPESIFFLYLFQLARGFKILVYLALSDKRQKIKEVMLLTIFVACFCSCYSR